MPGKEGLSVFLGEHLLPKLAIFLFVYINTYTSSLLIYCKATLLATSVLTRPVDDNVARSGSTADKINKDKR